MGADGGGTAEGCAGTASGAPVGAGTGADGGGTAEGCTGAASEVPVGAGAGGDGGSAAEGPSALTVAIGAGAASSTGETDGCGGATTSGAEDASGDDASYAVNVADGSSFPLKTAVSNTGCVTVSTTPDPPASTGCPVETGAAAGASGMADSDVPGKEAPSAP